MSHFIPSLLRLKDGWLDVLSSRFARWMKPLVTSLPLATLTDLGKSKSELIAENALLRKPLIVLRRQVKRPALTPGPIASSSSYWPGWFEPESPLS